MAGIRHAPYQQRIIALNMKLKFDDAGNGSEPYFDELQYGRSVLSPLKISVSINQIAPDMGGSSSEAIFVSHEFHVDYGEVYVKAIVIFHKDVKKTVIFHAKAFSPLTSLCSGYWVVAIPMSTQNNSTCSIDKDNTKKGSAV